MRYLTNIPRTSALPGGGRLFPHVSRSRRQRKGCRRGARRSGLHPAPARDSNLTNRAAAKPDEPARRFASLGGGVGTASGRGYIRINAGSLPMRVAPPRRLSAANMRAPALTGSLDVVEWVLCSSGAD